jgi:DNA repair exonuclease SbcCD ATPase subunit
MIYLGGIITFSFGVIQKRMINSHNISLKQANEMKKLNEELETDLQIMKEADEELKAANENFMEVVSSISTAVWKADIAPDGTYNNVYISPVADELMALTPGSINNDWDKFFGFIKPEYHAIANNAIQRAIKIPGKIVHCEFEVTKENGQIAWHHVKGKCFGKEDYFRLIGTTADITEIKKTSDELRKHKEHLEELVEERTSVLEIQKTDLQAMNNVFVGREFRIKELRDTVKELKARLGE